MKRFLLAMLALVAIAAPASGTVVIDTVSGLVGPYWDGPGNGPNTTDDFHNYFGGGSLIGDSFVANFYITAGSVIGFNSPMFMTADLTINDYTFAWTNPGEASGDRQAFDGGTNWFIANFAPGTELNTQAMLIQGQQFPGTYGLVSFTQPLPPDNFVANTAYFQDQAGGFLNLYVWNVNEPPSGAGAPVAGVPEPSTWALMLLGVVGLGFVFGRKRKIAALAIATTVIALPAKATTYTIDFHNCRASSKLMERSAFFKRATSATSRSVGTAAGGALVIGLIS